MHTSLGVLFFRRISTNFLFFRRRSSTSKDSMRISRYQNFAVNAKVFEKLNVSL